MRTLTATPHDVAAELSASQRKSLRIVIPGGSGHLGRLLAHVLHWRGHKVTVLSRTGAVAPWRTASWDAQSIDDWTAELDGADVLLNLCGRSVNCRYNAVNRREILDSRVFTTRLLGEAIRHAANPPRLWMNASTATIYRHAFDRAMDEATGELGGNEPDAPSAWNFSIEVATRWEQTFFAADTPATRKVALRSAIVMSPEHGGPFALLTRLVRLGLGGQAGSGEQFVSWIHYLDFIRAVEHLIDHEELRGPVNLAAPNPLRNSDFMSALRRAWGKSLGVSAPEWLIEIASVLLRTESELVLKSRRVVPGRLLESGFTFQFSEWPAAALDLVQRCRDSSHQSSHQQGSRWGGEQQDEPML